MIDSRILPEHTERKAIIYVRQSTADQVRHNLESQRRQYALVERARSLGFADVEVIDEDLGRSAATAVGRTGLAKVFALVGMREVGAVVCLEPSRLARNNRDWYQLLDLCAYMGTLIIDEQGAYDPRILNDRLLLGLKGTMSEFELGLIRQRAHLALQEKARRGELLSTVPIGYIRTRDDRVEMDPNLRVQQAVALVFDRFAAFGSVRQVHLWLRQEGVLLPRAEYADGERRLEWRMPIYNSVHRILTNPIYAGAYVFGRTRTVKAALASKDDVAVRVTRVATEDWAVCLVNHHPGYVDWETFQRNQRQIQENAAMKGSMHRGAAREGEALLQGLLRCGRCGRRLHVTYTGAGGKVIRYSCVGGRLNHGVQRCRVAFGGLYMDRAVASAALEAVAPAGLEAARLAAEAREREAVALALRQAQYEADRARRQYDACEPENRLVAVELEQRWNRALEEVARWSDRLQSRPRTEGWSDQERERLFALAHDLPAVWNDPAAPPTLKKRILRALIEEIVVDIDEDASKVHAVVRWTGGVHTEFWHKRNRMGQHRFRTERPVIDLIRELVAVTDDGKIAAILNRLGYTTGHGNTWTEVRIRSLRQTHHIPAHGTREKATPRTWRTLTEAAAELELAPMTVRRMVQDGILPATQIVPGAPWVIQREDLDSPKVRAAADQVRGQGRRPLSHSREQQTLTFQDM